MACIRYKGMMYHIQRAPFETEDRLQDRAWFCAKNMNNATMNIADTVNRSHKNTNKKYFNMEYVEVSSNGSESVGS